MSEMRMPSMTPVIAPDRDAPPRHRRDQQAHGHAGADAEHQDSGEQPGEPAVRLLRVRVEGAQLTEEVRSLLGRVGAGGHDSRIPFGRLRPFLPSARHRWVRAPMRKHGTVSNARLRHSAGADRILSREPLSDPAHRGGACGLAVARCPRECSGLRQRPPRRCEPAPGRVAWLDSGAGWTPARSTGHHPTRGRSRRGAARLHRAPQRLPLAAHGNAAQRR